MRIHLRVYTGSHDLNVRVAFQQFFDALRHNDEVDESDIALEDAVLFQLFDAHGAASSRAAHRVENEDSFFLGNVVRQLAVVVDWALVFSRFIPLYQNLPNADTRKKIEDFSKHAIASSQNRHCTVILV